MPDPLEDHLATDDAALLRVMEAARRYLPTVATRPAAPQMAARDAIRPLVNMTPGGMGALKAIDALAESALRGATTSTGPRYFDFVIGGATPAAMAADWLTSLFDQNAAGPGSSAWATELEALVLRELVSLFGLPPTWSGVLTTSSMSASFAALACATRWWGRQYGVDVSEDGLSGLPRLRVFGSALVHPTTQKALQMLGHGRGCVCQCSDDDAGFDPNALDRALRSHAGPAVIVATAGDASAGRFDPIAEIADLAEDHDVWLHVDGAFGLYTRLSTRCHHRLKGIERADSVAADAHKWLNVPYESGFCLLRDPTHLEPTFALPAAPYLPEPKGRSRGFGVLGPESSRRARAAPIWASIAAYGAQGLSAMVDRHLDAADRLAERVMAEAELELVVAPASCIVCFRWTRGDRAGANLDEHNRKLSSALAIDGSIALGTTVVRNVVALRAVLCNWRLVDSDVDDLVDRVLSAARELDGLPD